MKRTLQVLVALLAMLPSFGQLTQQQKLDDFHYLVAILNRNYAAYEWKRYLLGFEMLDQTSWEDGIVRTKNDFEYLDLLMDYMAQLRDTNTFLILPSDFVARLGFTVDIYDGRTIIETIDRDQLPEFPFATGDELISVDGKSSAQWIDDLLKFSVESNPRTNRRLAAEMITIRDQAFYPRAAEIGEQAVVVIRRAGGGEETIEVPWLKEGTPLRIGAVPDFKTARAKSSITTGDAEAPVSFWNRLQATDSAKAVAPAQPSISGFGQRAPYYDLPAGFQQRLGTSPLDAIFSGTYMADGKRIGYIRFASFSSQRDLDTEFTFMNQNTDGLIVDMMRAGGSSCTQERVAARLIGKGFRQPGFQLRASKSLLDLYNENLELSLAFGLSQELVRYYQMVVDELRAAYVKGERLTYPVPFCGTSFDSQPVVDRTNAIIAYTKPVLLITDELSGDYLPAALKDADRGRIYGMRTRASTGFTNRVSGPAFIETDVVFKEAIMTRIGFVSIPGFPESPYVENAGVPPDVEADFMTLENLRTKGKPFVEGFTRTIVEMIAADQR